MALRAPRSNSGYSCETLCATVVYFCGSVMLSRVLNLWLSVSLCVFYTGCFYWSCPKHVSLQAMSSKRSLQDLPAHKTWHWHSSLWLCTESLQSSLLWISSNEHPNIATLRSGRNPSFQSISVYQYCWSVFWTWTWKVNHLPSSLKGHHVAASPHSDIK